MKKALLPFFTLLLFVFSFTQFTAAQNLKNDTAEYPYWVEMMSNPASNYYETVKAFNLYWEGREITRGCGYKPFMRWAYDAQARILPDGTLESPMIDYLAFQTWKKEQDAKIEILPGGVNGTTGPCPKDGYWEELGPILYPRNDVSQPNGMGRVNAMAFHPTDSNIIYVGAPAGGLWKTTDGGKRWVGLTDDMPTLGVSAIHVHTSNPDIIYIGTGDRDAGNATGLGVYKSTNGGASFSASNTGMGNQTVCKIIVDENNQNTLLAATTTGIFRSTNGGANWTETSSINYFKDIAYKPGDIKYVYASSDGEFYLSQDSGKSFSRVTSGLPSNDIYRGVIGVSKASPSTVYYVVTEQRKFIGIYKSTNNGTSFSTVATAPNLMGYSEIGSDDGGQAFYNLDIAVNPNNINEIYVGGINIFKSSDGGVNWTIDAHWLGTGGKGRLHADQHALDFDPINNNLFVGNDGGFYKRHRGDGTWEQFSSTLAIGQVYRVSAAQTVSDFVVNGYQDNGMAYYQGKGSFVTFRGGDGVDNAVDPTNAQYYYGSYINGVITRHGFNSNGDIAGDGINGIDEEGAWVSPYILREGVPTTMITGLKNIWICTNLHEADKGDISWKKISNNLGSVNNKNMHKIENSPANNKILYASREDNTFYRTDDLTASTVTWTDLTSSLPNSSRRVDDIESHFSNQNEVFIIQNKKVYKSTNKGSTWTNISTGLPNITMYSLILDTSKTDGSIYVATYSGVYYKNDNMSSWISYSNNLPASIYVRDLEITYNTDPSEYRLIAGTYGRGTWQSQLYDNGIQKPIAEIEAAKTAICAGESITFYNTSDYYPENLTWSVTPSTGVNFIQGTDANSKDKISLEFTTAGSYEIKLVIENCNGADSTSINVNAYAKLTSATCNSTTTNLNNAFGIGIRNVKFHTLDNATSGAVASGSNEDFTCYEIIELDQNKNYTIEVETGNANNESVSVYIDYDNNGTFSTAERVFTSTDKRLHSGSFTTPTNSVQNKGLRLRVISTFGGNLPSGPCATFAHGQSEDYTIVILGDKADFTANKSAACIGQTVQFTNASSATGTYAWDFGTGASPATANTKGPHNVIYSTAGQKTVKLTVNGTLVEEKTNFITISQAPSMSISITKGSIVNCEKSLVELTANDANSSANSYEWNLGATKLSETSNVLTIPSFSSANVGNYTVKGIAGGCSHTSSAQGLAIYGKVSSNFTINPTTQCLKGNSFSFNNTSTGSNLSHSWNFGDGSTLGSTSPKHTYSNAGVFSVELISTTTDGCKDTASSTVTVDPEVNSNFSFTNPNKNEFDFSPEVTNYSKYTWDFDNGAGSSSTASSSYDFVDMGTYPVTLIVENKSCKDTTTKDVNAQFNSISNITGFDVLSISPNPTNGKIEIEFNLINAQELTFELYDIQGKFVERLQEKQMYSGSNSLPFDLNKIGLAKGNYFLKIKSNNGMNTIKIILQ